MSQREDPEQGQVIVTAPPVMAARAVSRTAEGNLDGGRACWGQVWSWIGWCNEPGLLGLP